MNDIFFSKMNSWRVVTKNFLNSIYPSFKKIIFLKIKITLSLTLTKLLFEYVSRTWYVKVICSTIATWTLSDSSYFISVGFN